MSVGRVPAAGITLAIAAIVVAVVLSGASDSNTTRTAKPSAATTEPASRDTVEVGCAAGGARAEAARGDLDVGPFRFIGGRDWSDGPPDAFNRHGYKIPASLLNGTTVQLRIPASEHGHVGLVYMLAAQTRAAEQGVRGADTEVRFTACAAAGRSGYTGGLVVDTPRCAAIDVVLADGRTLRARVPLGRPC